MLTKDDAVKISRRFIDELSSIGINLDSSWLFGSFAKGCQNDDSDIDIALVSNKFQGIRFYDRKILTPLLIKYVDIEPHTFMPSDFNSQEPFAGEIMKTGIRLT